MIHLRQCAVQLAHLGQQDPPVMVRAELARNQRDRVIVSGERLRVPAQVYQREPRLLRGTASPGSRAIDSTYAASAS
jgi:hypothetical protein